MNFIIVPSHSTAELNNQLRQPTYLWGHMKLEIDFQQEQVYGRKLYAMYGECSKKSRILAWLRPWICPYGPLVTVLQGQDTVLDIGCGTGNLLLLLCSLGLIRQGTGVDVAEAALRDARKAASSFNADLTFSSSPLINGEFDAVSMIDVMHHIPVKDQHSFFMDKLSHVKRGGLLCYKDMNLFPLTHRYWNWLHDRIMAGQYINLVPVENILSWTEEAGFVLERSSDYSRFLYSHQLRIFRRR
ncbi:MAG: class I SAM-dependent methyltransferase [Desulfovibrio sp.]|jgi:2-polyprenyl-3-methyl-5-hydroxy-6-metoxy-1,4-benzoquinol methylase|nr:class I SAM-dependent methyltransferase [Desulfovibrio sp.]